MWFNTNKNIERTQMLTADKKYIKHSNTQELYTKVQ